MITHEDQLNLFKIIAKEITEDIECYAFGGNAMMFYGFKEDTKDVDLFFEQEKARIVFIEAIKKMGFQETSPFKIYIPEKLREKHRPMMFKREDYRFDLFAVKIFHTTISPRMKEDTFALHEFKEKHTLKIKILRTEHIVQLKATTERDKDFEDILTIVKKDKNFNWQYLVDEALWQHEHGDSWALIDIGRVMKELKEYVFIEKKYFDQLYKSKEQNGHKA